jgi:predicted Zn-dependent protease
MQLASSQGGVPTWMSTHPDPGDRYNAVNAAATLWQDSLKLPAYKVNQDSYYKLIDGIVYGEDPRQGYTEGNTFYHPELKFRFSFPSGWALTNAPTQVTIQPSDGKALILFTLAGQKSLQVAADSTLIQFGLTLQRSEKKTVNGMPAIVMLSKQEGQDSSTGTVTSNTILSYVIEYGAVYYVFHSVSTTADFPNYASAMESSMMSFAKLTDASKINVTPKKIHIVKVQRTGTLASAFTAYGVKQDKMNELALLNDLELTDQVQAGKLIKIVGE